MADQYPRMIYRQGGDEDVFGLKVETSIVETLEEEQRLIADGWALTPFEAHGVEPPKADPVEEEPPLANEELALLDEIEGLQRTIAELRDALAAAEEDRTAAVRDADDLRGMLAEATKPAEKPKKETLGIKAV
jgi:hypothetical protein